MTFRPTPKQALFLWKMLTAEAPADREPTYGRATPRLDPKKERRPLVDAGLLRTERRGRATHLVATDAARRWAEANHDVVLLRSRSADGAIALEGLLRRLLPALRYHGVPLSDVIGRPGRAAPSPGAPPPPEAGPGLDARVAEEAHRLSAASRTGLVPLSELRAVVDGAWDAARIAVLALHEGGRLELVREDNHPALTPAMRDAAVQVGPETRHLFRWRG